MKTIIKISLILLFLQISLQGYSSIDNENDTLNSPKRALILSQSITDDGFLFTVIDLSNNEMVLLIYSSSDLGSGDISYFRLRKVVRTGIILDLEQQLKINICNSTSDKKK
jgi:hypothetical protein